ncbi:MAG: ComEC/Rec2 family competence protein [Bacteroidota bacterium]
MYFWNSYPFVRFSIAVIIGIVLFDQFPILWNNWMHMGLFLSAAYLFSVFTSHYAGFHKLRYLNGVLALVILAFLGGGITKFKYHSHPENHYRFIDTYIKGYTGIVSGTVNERTNHFRYELDLSLIQTDSTREATGKIHLYVKKDTLIDSPLQYGDKVAVKGAFFPVSEPDNPEEFNYKEYLAKQNVYAHSFVVPNHIKILENIPASKILQWAYSLKFRANLIIDKHIAKKRENATSKALLLGIKDYLDNDIKKTYASAGAMHVLAVSGLHVGIIYLILRILLGKLQEKGNIWRHLFGLVSVITIWFYALLTGLSPSVMRAATMFSLVAVGEAFGRERNIYNTLGIAAFILLIYDPYFIYSVGFQLSFAAVIGIVYLQPKLYQLVESKFWLFDKAWAITCVSIAAQLSTFPFSAYYFHQFPTYFLLSNLIVLPGAFLILILGVSMLMLDPIIEVLAQLLGRVLFYVMWLTNETIEQIEKLPLSLIEWIYMDKTSLMLTYVVVLTLISGLHFRSFKTLVISSVCCIIFIGSIMISHLNQAKEHKLLFYRTEDNTCIDHIKGHDAKLYLDEDYQELAFLSLRVDPYRLSVLLPPISESIISINHKLTVNNEMSYGKIGGQKIIMIDSTTFHLKFLKRINTNILFISNEAVKNIEWLSKNFEFDHLIIGNKNTRYYSRKMKKQAEELNVKIHSLVEDGAFEVDLK